MSELAENNLNSKEFEQHQTSAYRFSKLSIISSELVNKSSSPLTSHPPDLADYQAV